MGEPLIGRDTASIPTTGYQEPVAMAHDDSPHFAGRAQPGDVLGIETAGEETHVGDTAQDESKRRDSAIDADRKRRE
jgi:hypothetical protein